MNTRVLTVIVSSLAAVVAGLGGYIVGLNEKPSQADVDAARRTARSAARRPAFERARTAALVQGRSSGEKEGRIEGRERGKAEARRRMAKQRAALSHTGVSAVARGEASSGGRAP